jgi:hypothetical protein
MASPLLSSPPTDVSRTASLRRKLEAIDATLGCNLPELLVHDLELSNAVFTSKNMTAGAPASVLAVEDPSSLVSGHRSNGSSPISPYQQGLHRVRSLGRIDESCSLTEAHIPDEVDETSSDSGSDSESSPVEPPSIRFREQSVGTAATSLTSASYSAASRRHPTSPDRVRTGSWIDFEPDIMDLDRTIGVDRSISLPARLSSSMEFATPRMSSADATKSATAAWTDDELLDLVDDSRASKASEKERKRHSHQSVNIPAIIVPARSSSLSRRERVTVDDSGVNYTQQLPKRHSSRQEEESTEQYSEQLSSTIEISAVNAHVAQMTKEIRAAQDTAPHVDLDGEQDNGEEAAGEVDDILDRPPGLSVLNPPALSKEGSKHVVTELRPPLNHVQTWLETAIESVASPKTYDETSNPGVPLPPEVIETLRVSTTCFPETMLLSSSLSIETIRTYVRKLKHPGQGQAELSKERQLVRWITPPPTPPPPSKWKWANKLRSKRSQTFFSPSSSPAVTTPTPKYRPAMSKKLLAYGTPSSTSLAPPPWSSLRAVFPSSSDFLCDALYAHLVAYNYIASLCRNSHSSFPASARPSSRPSTSGRKELNKEDSNEVPKKAASLLGLGGETPDVRQHRNSIRMARKRSTILSTVGELGLVASGSTAMEASVRAHRVSIPRSTAATAGTAEHNPNRDLLAALAKCIARLVATLKATAAAITTDAAAAAATIPTVEKSEMDPFFLRSLCEIVRRSEEIV